MRYPKVSAERERELQSIRKQLAREHPRVEAEQFAAAGSTDSGRTFQRRAP